MSDKYVPEVDMAVVAESYLDVAKGHFDTVYGMYKDKITSLGYGYTGHDEHEEVEMYKALDNQDRFLRALAAERNDPDISHKVGFLLKAHGMPDLSDRLRTMIKDEKIDEGEKENLRLAALIPVTRPRLCSRPPLWWWLSFSLTPLMG